MTHRAVTLASVWAVCSLTLAVSFGQEPGGPAGKEKTPFERFRFARELVTEGRFDLAAEQLKTFVAANPSDKDFLDLQAKFGPTVFERLRQVPVWSEDAPAQAEALKAVDAVLTRAREATSKLYRDPERIRQFVRNLGATLEERIYAERELRPSGEAAVPVMVAELRSAADPALRSGILGAVTRLGPEVVPGFLAGLDGLPQDLQAGVLNAVAAREDVLSLTTAAESDPLPRLWYLAGGQSPLLRQTATDILRGLVGEPSRRPAATELLALARPFYDRTARFVTLDRATNRVRLWRWDAAAQAVAATEASKGQAEEFYGLRTLRWAAELAPADQAVQDLFLSLAVERAVERARFSTLLTAEPSAYQLVAAAPTPTVVRLLDRAIADGRTPLALGLTQALSDRGEKSAAAPTVVTLPNGTAVSRPPVLVKALDYPDPRVQLAAAVGLLRSPGAPAHGRQARVIEVLRRALASDPLPPGTTDMGRALIADPADLRADRVGSYLRQIGYSTERFATGRDLLLRVGRSADFDLIVVDRHVVAPMLTDVVAQLRSTANTGRRPVLVVASTDAPKPVPMERLLLRLAALVAATETDTPQVTSPFTFDPRRPPAEDVDAARREVRQTRDTQLNSLVEARQARLRRLVATADLPPNRQLADRLDLRLPQLTLAVLAAEYVVSPESAPTTFRRLQTQTALIQNRPELTAFTLNVPTGGLSRLIEQVEEALNIDQRTKLDVLRRRLDPDALALPPDTYRDAALEERLARQLAAAGGGTLIPEPFTLTGFATDVAEAVGEPAQQPRDPAEKKAAARVAVDWLRRIAVGDVPGYDARPAEDALRGALRDDELADPAIEALARLPSGQAQQDLLAVALTGTRPLPLRLKAADRAVSHLQTFGRFVPGPLAASVGEAARAEPDPVLRGRFQVLNQAVSGQPGDLTKLLGGYAPPLAGPAAAPVTAPDAAPSPEPKN